MPDPGTWRTPEVRTLLVFILTALAWITRSEPFGGWKTWLDLPLANDASVAFVAVIFLFCLPSGEKNGIGYSIGKPQTRFLGVCSFWSEPAFASGRLQAVGLKRHYRGGLFRHREFASAGNSPRDRLTRDLSDRDDQQYGDDQRPDAYSGSRRHRFGHRSHPLDDSGSHERQLRFFMLPVATIPNAVVFGTGEVSVRRMAREGLALNLIGAMVVSGICYLLLS